MEQMSFDFYSNENTMVPINGTPVCTRDVAREFHTRHFVTFFDQFLNCNGRQFPEGKFVGLALRGSHRTQQRSAIAFCLGIICGLSDQKYIDPRNEQAISTAKVIASMIEDGLLSYGLYI